MEFSFNLQSLFGCNQVFVVDKHLRPRNNNGDGLCKRQLCEVIDELGVASARAQRLPGPITTSSKLTFTDQKVYLYAESNYSPESTSSNRGCAVGFIKIGTKKLFLYDHQGVQREVSPLCILDFYVHESKQRKGYGKLLFDHMLQCEAVSAHHLAIDKPSDKFTAFLHKHYKLKATIPQVNNYVVFDGFFSNRKDSASARKSRFGKGKDENDLPGNPMSRISSASVLGAKPINHPLAKGEGQHLSGMKSSDSNHSLQGVTSGGNSSPAEELEALSNIPLARPSSREKLKTLSRHSPVTQTGDSETQSVQQGSNNLGITNDLSQLAVGGGGRSQSAQNNAYSRYTSSALPYTYSTSSHSDYQEPIRNRYGNQESLNTHQTVLNKQGHLRVTQAMSSPDNAATGQTVKSKQPVSAQLTATAEDWSKSFHSSGKNRQPNSSWNIFGVPPGYSHVANRKPV